MASIITNSLSLSFVWLIVVWPELALAQRSCLTPAGAPGLCVPSQECGFVKQLQDIYGRNIPRRLQNQMRQMQCNGKTDEFHLCCPGDTGTRMEQAEQRFTATKTARAAPGDLNRIDPAGYRLLDSVTQCGNRGNPKVSGGRNSKPGEFPWVALLKYETSGRQFLCGGSLISDRFILTAAHCIVQQPPLIGVRLGEHDLAREEDCTYLGGIHRVCQPPHEDFGVDDVRVHPSYSHGSINNDIALIKLDRSVVLPKSHIAPVCLPIDDESKQLAHDQSFLIAGWGRTDKEDAASIQQRALITRKDVSVCRNYYNNAPVNENHICATGSGIAHTCRGDSGGPLFFKHRFKQHYRFVQYGVISFGGQRCGTNRNQPGVFANIIDMLPWITQNLY
ncbi:phenoloxidase-activating factor 3 [Drosophila guanche]|uniref:CLIP domain-containing serine protease n=3 Tax=Drosophila guanche TaxID=7266 RepID=A0A3B0JJU3_DROGU|nr:phenoloxidase-activating factor 3 [Drosophila guanche]SPP80582.1 blast:Serine protease easter [Drosophila guanche]